MSVCPAMAESNSWIIEVSNGISLAVDPFEQIQLVIPIRIG